LIRESSWPVTVSHRIEDMINSYPHDIALKNGHGDALTYSALGKRVQSISNILISSGITEGQPVAVHQEPNFDFICSMLAILQIGAIYTPLQPDIPLPRLIRMALKTGIVAVLAHEWTLPTAQDLCAELPNNVSLINVSSILEVTEVITIRARPDFKAIILHTSGTTGDPKGVILSHSNIRNEAEHSANSYGIQREVVLQQSSPGFDMSLTQIFSALAFGGTLVVIPVSARKDPVAIARIIETENITFTAATPSEYSTWLENGRIHGLQKSSWKIAISGGEKVSKHLMAQFRKLEKFDLRLFNAYGPTESTCSATRMQLSLDESNAETIAAGYPAPNTSIYVLDEQLRPVPCGVIGEIYLGGSGVAIGYTDEAASRSSFVADPFADEGAETGSARVYRTGDIGRWSRAGTLLVDGRSSGDSQVKLRGLRIELQEVEEAIMNQGRGAVKRVVVTLRSYKTSLPETLIAHVVLSSDLSEKDIFETVHCIRTNLPLPQYMHPTIVIPMDFLPTQTSGKVDRQAVSTMPLPLMNEELDSNLSTSEKKLASLWYTLVPGIPTEQLTTNTDFFEAGGNSMLLIRLQANIYEVFDIKVALVHLFERSTLGSMSSLLEDSPGYTEKIYDWEIESSWTPAYRLNRDIVMQPILTSDKRVIVLTGASGFLGQGLLQRLLTDPSIATIHCIAVRNPETLSHLIQDSKLVIHKGDLRQPDLGLPTDSVVSIFEHAEAVIHNGADVSHMKSYAALKAANLDSTKELFKLCIARHVPFHFISTAGVALLSGLEEFDEISAAPYKPPADSSDGYTVTKWCSERFLEKASEEFDVPTYIHRPSSILREDEPGLDILQNMLKYIDITRASPSSNSLQGYFDVVYLDTVVNGVVQSLEGAPGQLLDYKHHSGDILVPFEELGTFCEQRFGALESLSMDKWIAKAEQAGLNGLVAAALRRMLDGEVTVRFPKLVKSN
jgi:hybrid polyketide synthase/nonribosomal peptide synthetase ACE1